MPYVSDKLYREVIVKMMGQLVSVVKVREIMPHMACLTLSDKEEIEAKRETSGNYNAMSLLLDCLRRRENWPEEFISALYACEHWALAQEISDAYDKIRGINDQAPAPAAAVPVAAPSAPPPAPLHSMPAAGPAPSTTTVPVAIPTTVTTVTIHSVPHSASPLLTPEGVPAQALPLPPKLAHCAEPVVPVSDPQQSPPSPVLAHKDIHPLEQREVSVSPGVTSGLGILSGPPSDAAPCLPTELLTTPLSLANTPSTTLQPFAPHEKSEEPMATTGNPSMLRHPVQDSHSPGKVSGLAQNSKNSSTANQLVDRVHTIVPQHCQTRAASLRTELVSSSTSDGATGGQVDNTAIEDEYLSKPGVLLQEVPLSISSDDLEISLATTDSEVAPMQPVPVTSFPRAVQLLQEPCSTTSADLMISSVTTVTTDSSVVQHTDDLPVEKCFPEVVSALPTDSSSPGAYGHSVSNSTHEISTHVENGFSLAPSSNQPVEDHYESLNQSLQSEPGTLVNTLHFSENPSIANLDACSPRMQGNVTDTNDKPGSPTHNTQYTKSVIPPVTFEHQSTVNNQGSLGLNASAMINNPPSEQREEAREGLLAQLQSDPRFISAAALIGVTAIFFAWRLKHKY